MTWPYSILFLLIIPAFISAENNASLPVTASLHPSILTTIIPTTTIPTTTIPTITIPTPTIPTTTEIPKPAPTHNVCNESQNQHLRNVSKDGEECLRNFIISQANHTDEPTCNAIESVNHSIFTLLNDSVPCFEKKKMPIIFAAGKTFVEFLNFSVAEDKHLRELFENGFTKCVMKKFKRIRQCVLNGTGLKKYYPWLEMPNLLNLELAEVGCSKSRLIRLCVEKTLKNETACDTTHIEYVNSLFNYTSRHCMQKSSNDENMIKSSKMTPGTIAVLILAMAAVVIISAVAIQKKVSERRQERCSQRVNYTRQN